MVASKSVNSLKSLNRISSDVSKSDLYSVAPHKLLEEEGFNARGAFSADYFEQPEVKAHIRSLADAYKRGDYVPPLVVKIRDGEAYIRDGHCRRRAIELAMSEGADIRKVQVLEHKGDEAEQAALIVTSQDGLSLSPLERAVVYQRLIRWGWSEREVSEKVGKTDTHVRQLLGMLEMPIELKQLVQSKVVSASYAYELFCEHGSDAIQLIKEAQESAAEKEGDPAKAAKQKVTKKHVAKRPRLSRKVLDRMQGSVSSITRRLDSLQPSGDGKSYTLTLSQEEVDELQALREKLAELENEAPEADAGGKG